MKHLWKGLLVTTSLALVLVLSAPWASALNEDLTYQGGHAIWAQYGHPNPGLITVGWDFDTPPDGVAEQTTVWNQGYFDG